MKAVTRIFVLISTFLVSGFLGFFNFIYSSKVSNYLNFLKYCAEEKGDTFSYSKMYIAIYILSAILILIAILSLLFNNFYNIKFKKTIQNIMLFINLAILITSTILLLIVYLKNYEILDLYSLLIDEEINVFELYIDLFLLLTFESVANIALSALSLKYIKDEENVEETDNENVTTEEHETTEEMSQKALLEKEIKQIKEAIEIEKLKSEYKNLYKQLQEDNIENKNS